MIIGIAGPYSADTEAERKQNLVKLNLAAATVFQMGHIPMIGVNMALPIVEQLPEDGRYEAIMKISMKVMETCDALWLLAESPGANRERDLFLQKGLPVYTEAGEIPKI